MSTLRGSGRWEVDIGQISVNCFRICTIITLFTQQEFLLQITRDDTHMYIKQSVRNFNVVLLWPVYFYLLTVVTDLETSVRSTTNKAT